MNPFQFGNSSAPLFGLYHPPQSDAPRPAGVLLCQPVGHEYMRAQRAVRRLADLLAESGFHVLRFDYRGTGDSAGETHGGRATDWVEDVGAALTELQDLSQAATIGVVGLRLGAALAARAIASSREVRQVVLWDPVVNGAAHLAELQELHNRRIGAFLAARPRHERVTPADDGSLFGFPFPPALRADIAALDLLASLPVHARLTAVVTEDRAAYAPLRQELATRGSRGAFHLAPDAGDWDRLEQVGGVMLAARALETIVTDLREGLA